MGFEGDIMTTVCTRPPGSAVCRYLLAAIFLGAACFSAPQRSVAQSSGPFAGYDGNWRGAGRVVGTNGNSEPIKCRATYKISPDGSGLSQTLTCASDSYRFDIRSDVVSDGSSLHGTWQELTRDATGNLSGRVKDGLVESTVAGPGFSARLSVRMSGRKQIVTIDPKGTDIAKVNITMTH
jgi:hypothetical protein